MTETNRLQLAIVRETTPGTTPTTPRMRKARITSESLSFTPDYVDPDEIRDDRMMGDPIKVMQASQGGVNFEVSWPVDASPYSEFLRSAFRAAWSNVNFRDNDGTADSVITDVATTNEVLTVTTGTAFVAGELYLFSGFAVANNNGVGKVTTGSATVPRFIGMGLTNEPAPPAAARVKCVGFQGASGDINATATGISSTALDFTTIPGIVVGKWLKIGGTAAGSKFVTAALNDWVRITAITATTLTFDNRPTGWTTETGTGLTVKFWFGDQIKNGQVQSPMTVERGFLGQTTPTYIVNTGMEVNTLDHSFVSRQKLTGTANLLGMSGAQSTVALDASPDAATTGLVMAANSNVGRLAEAGTQLTDPNWADSLTFTINNNLRTIESIDQSSPVAIKAGECMVSGTIQTYFGSNSVLAKLYAGTATAINARIAKTSQALIWQFPRVTIRGGAPNAGGKNQDVRIPAAFQSSLDTTTNAHVVLDRLEYYE